MKIVMSLLIVLGCVAAGAFAGCSAGLIGMLSAANQSGGEKTATAVWIGSVVAGALAGGGAGIALARKLHGQ